MSEKIIRRVIVDTPTDHDLFNGKGHERTANSLAQAIRYFDGEDRAIGLDGVWGSGKSSVVEIAKRTLAASDDRKTQSYHFFTFDIWKSQGSGFRRSFLEHFTSWAIGEFSEKRKPLENIADSIHAKTQEIETENQPVLGWFGVAVLFFLPLLPIYYIWAKNSYDDLSKVKDAPSFLYSEPMYVIYAFFTFALLAAWKKKKDSKGRLGLKAALSSILLITSKQHQDQKVLQKIREVDPNDYEFHRTLREILGVVQSDKHKVVVVLDNIDRLPTKEIPEYWALVRSIFSRTHQATPANHHETITAIVPYDRHLIEAGPLSQARANADNVNPTNTLASREIFSKTFDEILTISPPVLSNAREFFADRLNYALPKSTNKDERYRTYRIFNELVQAERENITPRRVVSFVNDISGIFSLHQGQYTIPTVSAYLAHQDLLAKDPGVLRDLTKLNDRIVDLAANPDLAKHLAAMTFNVDPDLAFQVLLDDVIARAAVAGEAGDLRELSTASGFDLRIDDVVKSSADEWIETGDFAKAVRNFSFLLEEYTGDSRLHLIKTLRSGFRRVSSIDFSEESYESYLRLFTFVPEIEKRSTLEHFITTVFSGLSQRETLSFSDGEKFSHLLKIVSDVLSTHDLKPELRQVLGRHSPPSSREFLFGFGASIARTGFKFSDFEYVDMESSGDGNDFVTMAIERPSVARKALVQFHHADLLSDKDWTELSEACLKRCTEEDVSQDEIADLMDITVQCWKALPAKHRASVPLATALAEGAFFRGLGSGESYPSQRAIADAFFLVGQTNLGKPLSPPTKLQPNGSRAQDLSDEFQFFNKLLIGEEALTKEQTAQVALHAKNISKFADPWITYGRENEAHVAVQQIVREGLIAGKVSNFNLSFFISSLEYFKSILSNQEFVETLNRYDSMISDTEISSLELADIPVELVSDIGKVTGPNWRKIGQKIESALKKVSRESWKEHLADVDHISHILIQMVESSDYTLDGANFRDPIVNLVLEFLAGETEQIAQPGLGDKLFAALDQSYRTEACRTIREKLRDVSASSLESATIMFPGVISDVIQGDRVAAKEKDNVVRHILCPALEGGNRHVLDVFLRMGPARVASYRTSSDDSTRQRLEGAVKSFSERKEDREWTQDVVNVVLGKKRTKTLWEIWFGS